MIKKGDRVAVMSCIDGLVKGVYLCSDQGFALIKTENHYHDRIFFKESRLKPIIRVYGY